MKEEIEKFFDYLIDDIEGEIVHYDGDKSEIEQTIEQTKNDKRYIISRFLSQPEKKEESKIQTVERLYGKDFGVKIDVRFIEKLKKNGFSDLAKLFERGVLKIEKEEVTEQFIKEELEDLVNVLELELKSKNIWNKGYNERLESILSKIKSMLK